MLFILLSSFFRFKIPETVHNYIQKSYSHQNIPFEGGNDIDSIEKKILRISNKYSINKK
jgi:hypothetical protein